MNQLYRALHMPPLRLVRKLMGHKEIYTIGWRRFVPGGSLPETGAGEFTPMPYSPDYWYADPMLFEENGEHWLFCEAYDRRTHKGLLAVSRLTDEGPETPVPRVSSFLSQCVPLAGRNLDAARNRQRP